jgi:hypothetical protein
VLKPSTSVNVLVHLAESGKARLFLPASFEITLFSVDEAGD